MKIGVFSIFTNEYKIFHKHFVKNLRTRFFSKEDLHWVFLSDTNLKKNKFIRNKTTNKIILNEEWPYNTLKKFHYYQDEVYPHVKNFDYVFFLNSNARCYRQITKNDIDLDKDYTFVLHDNHIEDTDLQKPFERNRMSSACYDDSWIPSDYIGARFVGGKPEKFLEMAKIIISRIESDLRNEIIAIFHDESHLNWFYNTFKHKIQYNLLSANYHIPEQHSHRDQFTDKCIFYQNKQKKRYKHLNFVDNTKSK